MKQHELSTRLTAYFEKTPHIALGFSGGVDSSYLLYEAVCHKIDIRAYYIKTAFQPEFEMNDAIRITNDLGTNLSVLEVNIFDFPDIIVNTADRCYHCKKLLFQTLKNRAAADGYSVLADGTNASDDSTDRPGMRALKELSICSPLRECGFTKQDVRELSKRAGLFTWDKPAYACLATRIPTGKPITKELLQRVEYAEDALFRLGYSDFRVRVYGDAARLQFTQEQMNEAVQNRDKIYEAIKPYFDNVFLDMAGR